MIFDLKLVPVAHEHGVDVIYEVGHRKEDVGAGQPVSDIERDREAIYCVSIHTQISRTLTGLNFSVAMYVVIQVPQLCFNF